MAIRTVASETEFTIIGNTFECKDIIKACGFKWDAENRMWVGDAAARDSLLEQGNPVRGRKTARLVNALKIGPVYYDVDTEEPGSCV